MKTMEISATQARSRWTHGQFGLEADYYAGLEPGSWHLTGRTLERIYKGILHTVGKEEAVNFVRFVDNLKDLSPAEFIVAFEKFWDSGCTEVSISQSESDRYGVGVPGKDNPGLLVVAFGRSLFGSKSKEEIEKMSLLVKEGFLEDYVSEL